MPILNKTPRWDFEGLCRVRFNIDLYCHPVDTRRNSYPSDRAPGTAGNFVINRRPKAGFKQYTFFFF